MVRFTSKMLESDEHTKLIRSDVNAHLENGKQDLRTSPIHLIQNNIQTLRSLAIWFVLLFHMWPTRFTQGYLGVDIFFVISGYLMCLILFRKRPINLPVCVDFYYRRVKRIVPLYFTVILVVLVVLQHVISPIEFAQLYEEAIPALGFYSNIPNMREAAYFDISSELYYFLHSWSLSVELQFYLIVPLIFVFFDRIEKFRLSLRLALIAVIPITSFIFQCYASKDFAHMLLPARIWQFFVGFGAFYLREQRFLDLSREDVNKWIDSFKIAVAHGLLIVLLVFSLPIVPQLQRLFVVLLTGVVVGSHCETSVLFNLRPTTTLGDISYSVYLIHWPLFTWHKYAHSEIYTDGGEPNIATGLQLIAISIVVGYVVENAFKWLMKRVNSWSALTFMLCILLCLNGIQLHDLRNFNVDLTGLNADQLSEETKQQIRDDIEMLWLTRANPSNYTNDLISRYNVEQFKALSGFVYCDSQSHSMPTSYPLDMSVYAKNRGFVYTCHREGNGTKNIVVIGNSHAYYNFPGIAYIFRQTYKRITLFARSGCRPSPLKFQKSNSSWTAEQQQQFDECSHLLNATTPALRAWKEPIDIVIALYAMVGHTDTPLSTTVEEDELYLALKKFYTEIAEIARETLIIMDSFLMFLHVPVREVESRMKTGKPSNRIGNKLQSLHQRMPNIKTRLEHLNCSKCLNLDMISFWCHRTRDHFCHATSSLGLIYFSDRHHPSALGSFYTADEMFRLYHKQVI